MNGTAVPEPDAPDASASRPSGLRNPTAAVRAMGAGTLVMEALVLLLAIQPIRVFGGRLGGAGVAAAVGLAMLAVLIAAMMGRRWAWPAGAALQGLLLLAALLHWSFAAVGLIFAAVWAYLSHVRRTIQR